MAPYDHPRFSLDRERKEVKDENGKLLRVTGDPYRLLELLCQRHPASITITDINIAFDPAGAREYTEAHVRAMKNRIHTAIGRDVIKYQNRVYSLVEELKKVLENDTEGENVIILKESVPFDVRKLRGFSVLKMPNFLRIHGKTLGGGTIAYIDDKYKGTP